jgi:hypothetical protein
LQLRRLPQQERRQHVKLLQLLRRGQQQKLQKQPLLLKLQ